MKTDLIVSRIEQGEVWVKEWQSIAEPDHLDYKILNQFKEYVWKSDYHKNQYGRDYDSWQQAESNLKEYKLRVQQEQEDVEKLHIKADKRLTELKKNPNHVSKILHNQDEQISFNTGFINGFEEGYSAASLKAKGNQRVWIPVNDVRKPEKGQRVLVIQNPKTTATKEALFAVFNGERFMPPEKYPDSNEGDGFVNLGWSDIIYWMPLPSTNIEQTGYSEQQVREAFRRGKAHEYAEHFGAVPNPNPNEDDYIQSLHPQHKVGDVLKCEVDEVDGTATPV